MEGSGCSSFSTLSFSASREPNSSSQAHPDQHTGHYPISDESIDGRSRGSKGREPEHQHISRSSGRRQSRQSRSRGRQGVRIPNSDYESEEESFQDHRLTLNPHRSRSARGSFNNPTHSHID